MVLFKTIFSAIKNVSAHNEYVQKYHLNFRVLGAIAKIVNKVLLMLQACMKYQKQTYNYY